MQAKKLSASLSIFFLVLLVPLSLLAADYYVAPTASGTGDCLSPVNACEFQTALDTAAGSGEDDTIHLAAGNYDASVATFTYRPADPENYALTIVGERTNATVLDGGGTSQNLNIETRSLSDDSNAYITVKGVTFLNGYSTAGGGLYVLTRSAHITMEDSKLSGNFAGAHGGGAYAGSDSGTITFTNNIFSENSALGGGGAAAHSAKGAATLTNNIFSENSADNYGGGAGVWSYSGKVTLTNNTLSGNYGDGWGGGILVFLSGNIATANMFNNIVWNNNATNGGDIYVADDGEGDGTGATVNLYNNDYGDFAIKVGDKLHKGNNINDDPLFVDPANGDFHLQAESPCIDKGDPYAPGLPETDFEGNPRIMGAAPDIGADEFPFVTIEDMLDEVENLIETGVLNKGQGKALIAKLEAAKKMLNEGNTTPACNKLQAFINQVEAYINAGILSSEEGQSLIGAANSMISQLCG